MRQGRSGLRLTRDDAGGQPCVTEVILSSRTKNENSAHSSSWLLPLLVFIAAAGCLARLSRIEAADCAQAFLTPVAPTKDD